MSTKTPNSPLSLLQPFRRRLGNGVTSVVTPVAHRQQAVVFVYLETGSRFEDVATNGLSHFVEHMLFRGTKCHGSSHELATAFEELGGTLEAMTAADHGSLAISVPNENLGRVLQLMGEVFAEPTFGDIEVERGIIVEELLEDLNEDGQLIDPSSLTRQLTFGAHPLGRTIIGPLKNVRTFRTEDLFDHHRLTYRGTSTVVSVAGSVEPERVSDLIEASFGEIPEGTPLDSAPVAESQTSARTLHVRHPGSSQTSVALSYRALGRTDPRYPALEMLLRVLDDGMSTPLYQRICDSKGLCYSVSAGHEAYRDSGIFEIHADAAHERAATVLEEMFRVTNDLAERLVSSEELDRARNRTRWEYEALLDDVEETADFFGLAELHETLGHPHARLVELLTVSREEIQSVAREIFAPERRNVVTVGNLSARQRSDVRSLALG